MGFYTADRRLSYLNFAFNPAGIPGTPTREALAAWYADAAGWDPRDELTWGVAFNVFRGSAILQGIAARVARGQATSEQAKKYADSFRPLGELAWSMVQEERGETESQAKL